MATKNSQDYLQRMLIENWRREMEAAKLYQITADSERDPRRKEIFQELAAVEQKHAHMWEEKLRDLQYDITQLVAPTIDTQQLDTRDLIRQIESVEEGNGTWYESLKNVIEDPEILKMIEEIDADEAQHQSLDYALQPTQSIHKHLKSIWGAERWHRQNTGSWVGDAIYGVNDGLGAIFGIIAGVAGFTQSGRVILISGFFGAVASTLSMGAGAWLATKSENELMETEIAHERQEIQDDPEHELEELALLYELKGFSKEEATQIAGQIATDPEQFLKTMAQEELGIHETSTGNPWRSALFGSLSTFVGAIVPLIPFFFLHGWMAMIVAAVVSLAAHFAVGAAKSMITVRSWWSSGLEMTLVGVIVGVVSYGLGLIGSLWL